MLNFNHRAPVLGAGIPTSPAPGTYATDGNGAFTLSNINSRTYKISVRKPGSRPKILSVAVRVDETIQGTIYLERDDETNQVDSLTAEIVNWPNRLVNSDTAYVDVVYRTRNAGTTDLSSYGVYVRIEQRTAPTSEKSRERTCPLSG